MVAETNTPSTSLVSTLHNSRLGIRERTTSYVAISYESCGCWWAIPEKAQHKIYPGIHVDNSHRYIWPLFTLKIGITAGGILYVSKSHESLERMRLLHGNFINLFMLFLLPAIIFEAGYNMHKVLWKTPILAIVLQVLRLDYALRIRGHLPGLCLHNRDCTARRCLWVLYGI